ncbi:MAG: energy-dependent translational throttle protein EttA [Flavobacteriales bacterium]|nr:energy-dependent translational throttle protein EttA [Flavobacteriales bacterium]
MLKDVTLGFYYGAKIGILGANGSGKSTVMKIIAGIDDAYTGDVTWAPGLSVGYLSQEPDLDENKTVREIVEEGTQEIVDVLKEYEAINAKFMDEDVLNSPDKMEALINRQAEVQDQIDALNAWELDTKLSIAMDALRCPPDDSKIGSLSGGERRRVALCRLLLQQPDVLLLDEPTNHLDAESIDWLEQHLEQYSGTVLCVTHDRYFLDNVAKWILELDRGEGIPYEGNYASWLEQKTKRMAQEEKHESKRRKELERELEWVRQSPKGRRTKNKARVSNYEAMLSVGTSEKDARLSIPIPNGPRLGNLVIEATKLQKAFGERLLIEDLSFSLPPAGIVGVIGPNGAGKTTLFRMIMGEEKADDGSFKMGDTVEIGYVDQRHADIDPTKTVWQVISGGNDQLDIGGKLFNSRAYVSKFNFNGTDQQKKCNVLSGGELNRLHLAMTLKTEANVLLLDEPTNDIDVDTLRALEEGIESFAGCAVVISHDRYFLDRICTHILAFEGDSQVYWFEGTYSEYEENRKKRLGNVGPKRVKYRKLVRE